jgi:hypothetical protein
MNRQEYMVAVLAAAGGTVHTPVQVQKLFFLLDKKIPEFVGGPYFDFQAHDYGPFDKNVYSELERLANRGLVSIDEPGSLKSFRLTVEGNSTGSAGLADLPSVVSEYIARLSQWVRSLSFADLVSAIYREYPEMRANSIFRG